MWFTVCLHGIGMYMMTDCMHTSFPLTRTACGGIGVGIIHMAPAGDSVGDGVRHGTTIVGTIPVIGVAATGVAIGDGTRGTVPISITITITITITTIRPTTTIVPTTGGMLRHVRNILPTGVSPIAMAVISYRRAMG